MNWQEFYDYLLEATPREYHDAIDAESDFYKDQKKRYDANKKPGKPPGDEYEYRIDPRRDHKKPKNK